MSLEFSKIHHEAVYDKELRYKKAKKICAILAEYYGKRARGILQPFGLQDEPAGRNSPMAQLSVLDLGCGAGTITAYLSKEFANVTGIDNDRSAIEYALHQPCAANLSFHLLDALESGFPDASFDIVICNHAYEHVDSLRKLLREVRRMLRPGGICYFSAENRLNIMEAHYKLPFLSYLPKAWAHLYLRLTRKGRFYCENLMSYWGLKRLVSEFDFEIIDYTPKIINRPDKYAAVEMFAPGSYKQKILRMIAKFAYWLCSTYIWLLKKG